MSRKKARCTSKEGCILRNKNGTCGAREWITDSMGNAICTANSLLVTNSIESALDEVPVKSLAEAMVRRHRDPNDISKIFSEVGMKIPIVF